ncbi:MAG: hypothetical protein ACHQX3_00335 [Nitrospirales bacterium]
MATKQQRKTAIAATILVGKAFEHVITSFRAAGLTIDGDALRKQALELTEIAEVIETHD